MMSPSVPPRVDTWNSWPGLPVAGAAAAGVVAAAGALVAAGAVVGAAAGLVGWAGAAVGEAAPPQAAIAAAPARPPASVSRRRRDSAFVMRFSLPSLGRTGCAAAGTARGSAGAPPRRAQ